MIGYVTLGTNDLPRAAAFYDACSPRSAPSALMGFGPLHRLGRGDRQTRCLGVIKPFDEKAATVGNGVMVALVVDSRDKVKRVHAKALQLGGRDEGAVGPRGEGFYAGYFRDLDGNKLNVFFMG